jgi:hypothetical protein
VTLRDLLVETVGEAVRPLALGKEVAEMETLGLLLSVGEALVLALALLERVALADTVLEVVALAESVFLELWEEEPLLEDSGEGTMR